MVRTEAGHCTETSRCSPSRMCRTFSAPITRTVGRPKSASYPPQTAADEGKVLPGTAAAAPGSLTLHRAR
ncbi:hypothetical protein DV515_00005945 [Chloebia gouldiae]|uniref:Uncharacterized protein n=1 Tax=Chloebia gouldiae TaxID=44316 RepID=A0A3L8SLA6_CHLGU|nr:hypothetical protein DV515_00005945 [Chloebia gouldiae]